MVECFLYTEEVRGSSPLLSTNTMKKKLLMTALNFAVDAHKKQFDKAGLPYVLHPIRVAEAMETEEEKVVALLHDVVEDTSVTLLDIYAEFNVFKHPVKDTIHDAVNAMTKRHGEKYQDYLDRVAANPIAKAVKIADMADNSKPERIRCLSIQKQLRLLAKYTRGRHYLLTGEWHESKDLDSVIKAGYRT